MKPRKKHNKAIVVKMNIKSQGKPYTEQEEDYINFIRNIEKLSGNKINEESEKDDLPDDDLSDINGDDFENADIYNRGLYYNSSYHISTFKVDPGYK